MYRLDPRHIGAAKCVKSLDWNAESAVNAGPVKPELCGNAVFLMQECHTLIMILIVTV